MKHKHLTISALALILMSACTEATGVEPNDLAGTWTATSIVFTSVTDPTLTVDLATEGATMSLTLNADGTYSWAFVFPGEPTENETGTYTVSGNTLTTTESDNLSGVSQVQYRNAAASWVPWEAPSASKAWILESGTGTKTVEYQIQDTAGNLSLIYSDSINVNGTTRLDLPAVANPLCSP